MLEEFINPPASYGEVAFYWWVGEPLTKERLSWQLEQLKDHHICALQINYCHGNKGGQSFGLTMESDPPLFSADWWSLVGWFIQQCKVAGICVSLSDYTLGIGQGYYMDEILREYPDICGQYLDMEEGRIVIKTKKNSVNPLDRRLGPAVIRHFFEVFEKKFPGECGKALNFFFSDELSFQIRGKLWHPSFSEEFRKRKGYDLIPFLKGLFEDIGDQTQKIRLDYYDVVVQMEEEAYFMPIYQWHQNRGMTYGCDHGGRGRDVTEFGDYFRTQRWNQGPGNDQPELRSDIVKNKVASSIAHLYQRPRTWLEGFYGSGWGTTSSEIADAVFRNFCMGHNLLTLHGLYYTTYGSMWEWAPPCNHFRMPYWKHMDSFLLCTKRLSWLMSQGIHVKDVAVLYPVAAVEGGLDGEEAVTCSFSAAEQLYDNGIDFDFMDFESLDRATIGLTDHAKNHPGKALPVLQVAGNEYRVLIIPSMKTIRYSSLQKAAEFSSKGGLVLFIGNLPEASDRIGRNDEMIGRLVSGIVSHIEPLIDTQNLAVRIRNSIVTDYEIEENVVGDEVWKRTNRDPQELSDGMNCHSGYFQHRQVEEKEIYFLYGIEKGSRCRVRSIGRTEILDPWTAEHMPFAVHAVSDDQGMSFFFPLEKSEMMILLVDPCKAPKIAEQCNTSAIVSERELTSEWECEILPTMDNSYGDFVQPPSKGCLGPRCVQGWFSGIFKRMGIESHFQKYGPFPKPLKEQFCQLDGQPVTVGGNVWKACPYRYSLRYGIENDPGNQYSYHGNKGKISDEFLCMGKKKVTYANSGSEYIPEDGGQWYYFVSYVKLEKETKVRIREGSMKANRICINGVVLAQMEEQNGVITLSTGINRIALEYGSAGRTYFVLEKEEKAETKRYPLASVWYQNENILPFMDTPEAWKQSCCFKTATPPGVEKIKIRCSGVPMVLFNGEPTVVQRVGDHMYCCDVSEGKYTKEAELQITIAGNSERYGADCLEEIEYQCGSGVIQTGDWGNTEGLWAYSGGIRYRKQIYILKINSNEQIICDLGEVGSSVKLWINGVCAGVRLNPPYRFDITKWVKEGENQLEAEVYNSLYNHYRTVSDYYNDRKQKSGLVGPVRLIQKKI